MSDEQEKKTDAAPPASGGGPDSDRPVGAPSTLGGLADLLKATQAGGADTKRAPVTPGLAELVMPAPKPESAQAPASPFDQKVGSAASQYTFVMNSADLKDLIGDPSKQRVSVHSAASAGFESAPKPAPSDPAKAEVPAPLPRNPSTRDLPSPRAPSRASSRIPMVKTRPERSGRPLFLVALVVLLLLVLLLIRRDSALDFESLPTPAASEVEASPKE